MPRDVRHSISNIVKFTTILFCVLLVLQNSISLYQSSVRIRQEILIVNNSIHNERENTTSTSFSIAPAPLPPQGYLVWNKHCRIPDINPFTPDAMKIFKKRGFLPCTRQKPLTGVSFDMNSLTYSLHIDQDVKNQLTDEDISCCYQSILRAGKDNRIDRDYKLKDCVPFEDGDVVPQDVENLLISCNATTGKRQSIQKDAFYLVVEKPEVRERLKSYRNGAFPKRPISVLMLGIDSMSKFNLRRVMPETTKRLLTDNWFELKGYNKVEDNTYPNLMAFLTGYNLTTANSKCDPGTKHGLMYCKLLWNYYRSYGYVTGYAEDETWMSTFNFNKLGFSKPPVDYYHRPFMLGIEDNLKINKLSGMSFCIGMRHAAEYVYDAAVELATRYKGEPYFGLYWANTFSHNSFSDPSTMDKRMVQYIDQLTDNGVLDESILIFFSDHGMRFGPLRSLRQGFLEERLPFIFIWLPYWFRVKYPQFAEALESNKHRLTNAYDLHVTLMHILELSGRTPKLPQSEDCPNCQSLFYEVPQDRSCQDIAIDEHWCTCIPYEDVKNDNKIIKSGIAVVLKHLNTYLEKGNFFPLCENLKLKEVESARKRYDFDINLSSINETNALEHYRVRFLAQKGKFEASITYSKALDSFKIVDSVSRLDAYKEMSECIEDSNAKKYCICDKRFNAAKSNKTI